ncbi:MAG TPA: hypothetical protein VFI38_13720 [Candidatus Acidoferrum sp.]|nr:hypothetical protein [Candidatus Acidoferrum sp.]
MRRNIAACVAGVFLWTSLFAEMNTVGAQETEKAAAPKQDPGKTASPETVKPIPGCGFCLEDGTKVNLTLGRELSSGKEATGNRVDFVVAEEVRVNDLVVIQKGAAAYGTIVEAQARRRMGRAGKLNVRIEEVRLADGSRAKLRAVQDTKGKGRQGVMTAAMIGAGVLFFPVAPMFLFMRGRDVVIAQGTPVAAYVDGNTELVKEKYIGMEPTVEKPPAQTEQKKEL